ncbi:MAG TPA: zinc metalloprotease HtpX [Candidatus Acidoferrales bacterium]|nr:zinc metalloprotease HtpX [Candidatus Acidoferrales bacterium]
MKTLKTAFLLTALTLLLILGGEALGGRRGMTLGLAIAVVMNGVAYFFSDKIALRSAQAEAVTREQAPRLYAVMERLAGKAGLPMPKLYVSPQAAPNAFATGRNPHHAAVCVTAGLMQIMNDDELEGVIAHELSHVRNYDILTSSIAATIAGAITWVAEMGRWGLIFGGYGGGRDGGEGEGNAITAILMLILAPIAALLLQLGISRQREYQADASGVKMVGHPYGLISALQKLEDYNKKIPMAISPSTAALCIVAPLQGRQMLANLFSTHPPLDQRIEILKNMQITR